MRVLVTGINGSIGCGFKAYMEQKHTDVEIVMVSLRGISDVEIDSLWNSIGAVDAVYYCIGVVNERSPELFRVNADLAYVVARSAKKHGISKFVYLSSMAVYNFSGRENEEAVTLSTIPSPVSNYGRSKLEGERKISVLADSSFQVNIIRAPSIFGRNSEAYLEIYVKAARKGKCFDICRQNKRSALYIDNLSEFVHLIICGKDAPYLNYFLPQNREMLSWTEFVYAVSLAMDIPCRFVKLPKMAEKVMLLTERYRGTYRKVMYAPDSSACFRNHYCIVSADEAIRLCVDEMKGNQNEKY